MESNGESQILEVKVAYKARLDQDMKLFMTKEFIKYVLFLRGQIPMMYDDTARFVQEKISEQETKGRKRKLIGGQAKRGVKFLQAFTIIMKALEQLFAEGKTVYKVAVVLGTSVMTMKELFLLDFDLSTNQKTNRHVDAAHSPCHPSFDRVDVPYEEAQVYPRYFRKLIRHVAQHAASSFLSKHIEPSRIHILVCTDRNELQEGSQSAGLRGFLPKLGINLNVRRLRKKRLSVLWVQAGTKEQAFEQETTVGPTADAHACIAVEERLLNSFHGIDKMERAEQWLSASIPLRGFSLPNS